MEVAGFNKDCVGGVVRTGPMGGGSRAGERRGGAEHGLVKTLWDFCCGRKKRHGIIARGESEFQKLWVFNMRDITACYVLMGLIP